MSENKVISWDEYFMQMAWLASKRSSCKRKQVGCIIVNNNRVVATGYNGFIEKTPHISIVKDNHEQATIHAEVNAICDCAKRGASSDNSYAYITHFPCLNCFKTLVASELYKNDPIVYQLAEQSKIELIHYIIQT